MTVTREPYVYFYGKLAGATRHDAGKLARAAGYRVAEALSSAVDYVVLGEGTPLSQTRAKLAAEFDERSALAFEKGALKIVSESEFLLGLDDALNAPASSESASDGATPAAVASAVGVSVATIRRWLRRGLLAPIDPTSRLPKLDARELLVAKRLAFLCSGEASEEQVERRIRAFAQEARERQTKEERPAAEREPRRFESATPLFELVDGPEPAPEESGPEEAPLDLGATILTLTLSTDGRELLRYRDRSTSGSDDDGGPTDSRGQRFFEFAATPPDGSGDMPTAPARLSPEEEQIALAERLSEWNARTTASEGTPALLALFPGDETSEEEERAALETALESEPEVMTPDAASEASSAEGISRFETPTQTPPDAAPEGSEAFEESARAKWREAASRRQVTLCAQAWNYEHEGYWEEAAKTYRLAGLAGGADAGVNLCLGKVLYLLEDYSAARERFCCAIELDPDLDVARVELGRTYAALGDFDEALATFRAALDFRPNDPLLRVELGKLLLQKGNRPGAEEEFRRAASGVDDPQLAADVRRLLITLENALF